jgi:hypothetical protein
MSGGLGGAGEAQSRLSDERDRYFRTMRAQDEGGQENTSMTLVGCPAARNRNELVSILIPSVRQGSRWDLLRHVSAFGKDAVVTLVIRNTGLTATARGFAESLPPGWVKPHVKVVGE